MFFGDRNRNFFSSGPWPDARVNERTRTVLCARAKAQSDQWRRRARAARTQISTSKWGQMSQSHSLNKIANILCSGCYDFTDMY